MRIAPTVRFIVIATMSLLLVVFLSNSEGEVLAYPPPTPTNEAFVSPVGGIVTPRQVIYLPIVEVH